MNPTPDSSKRKLQRVDEPASRVGRLPAVLDYGFRPMFLAAAGWAMIALALWLAMFAGYVQLPTRFNPLAWHAHEMLFGFVMAAVAGFLLTAIPNWTSRPPMRGHRLAALAVLWLLGRLACLVSAELPAWLAVTADLSFPVCLLAFATREITASRNWRNLPVTIPLVLFIVSDVLMHLESAGISASTGLGWRLAVGAPILMISFIGGRIIPAFTRNWLSKRNSSRLPSAHNFIDTAALGVLAAALTLWAFLPGHHLSGAPLLVAALLQALRLARWAGLATWPEPLLFILHVGYGWVAAGTALLGLSSFDTGVPAAAAIHALTAGAIAVMILAVMPRVTLGHTGRALTANRSTVVVFTLINAAAIARVCASWHPESMIVLLMVAGACWIAAFGLFEIVYGPMLLRRRSE